MMSPDILNKTEDRNFLEAELTSSYNLMIKAKTRIIYDAIVKASIKEDEKVYSVGLGFAVTVNS